MRLARSRIPSSVRPKFVRKWSRSCSVVALVALSFGVDKPIVVAAPAATPR
jgi:hypothetical protein